MAVGKQVRVDLGGDVGVGVPELAAHHDQGDARSEHQARGGVAQAVRGHQRYAVRVDQSRPNKYARKGLVGPSGRSSGRRPCRARHTPSRPGRRLPSSTHEAARQTRMRSPHAVCACPWWCDLTPIPVPALM